MWICLIDSTMALLMELSLEKFSFCVFKVNLHFSHRCFIYYYSTLYIAILSSLLISEEIPEFSKNIWSIWLLYNLKNVCAEHWLESKLFLKII